MKYDFEDGVRGGVRRLDVGTIGSKNDRDPNCHSLKPQ